MRKELADATLAIKKSKARAVVGGKKTTEKVLLPAQVMGKAVDFAARSVERSIVGVRA